MKAPPPFPCLTVPSAATMNPFSIFSRLGSLDFLRICPLSLVDVSSRVDVFFLFLLT